MTKNEVVSMFRVICVLFPQSAKNFSIADEAMRDYWHMMIGDQSTEIVGTALKKYALTHTFAPSIAEILKIIGEIKYPENALDPDEAWALALNAIRKGDPMNAEKSLANLPKIVADTVKSLGWRELCMSENISVDRGQFRKAYETRLARIREDASIPPQLKNEISKLSESFKIRQLTQADKEFLTEYAEY